VESDRNEFLCRLVDASRLGTRRHQSPVETTRDFALELIGVTKSYGDVIAVDGVNLAVRKGEFVTLLGPSGSGKTTTLRLVAGFTKPSAGTMRIRGVDITSVPPHERDVGMVFQNYALFPHMTARSNIAFPLRMRGFSKREQRRLVDEVVAIVRLEGLEDRYPRQLSGGQQQRVAFARAVVYKPGILLMDEPLGALDRRLRESLQLEIRRIHQQLGITVLYVTHDQEEALVLSDRIALFNRGKIAQLGTAKDLYHGPETVFAAEFVGDSNVLIGRLEMSDTWQLACGPWHLPCRPGPSVRAIEGERVALVVRPERLRLVGVGDRSRLKSIASVIGTIRQVIFLGPYVKYEIEAGDQTLFARRELSADEPVLKPGDEVAVQWHVQDSLLVPD
jgi:putative spermidine/putrescine transport system ATP-binding protein